MMIRIIAIILLLSGIAGAAGCWLAHKEVVAFAHEQDRFARKLLGGNSGLVAIPDAFGPDMDRFASRRLTLGVFAVIALTGSWLLMRVADHRKKFEQGN